MLLLEFRRVTKGVGVGSVLHRRFSVKPGQIVWGIYSLADFRSSLDRNYGCPYSNVYAQTSPLLAKFQDSIMKKGSV